MGYLILGVLIIRILLFRDTLYTFWDNITHYKTESVNFLGLMNSATKHTSQLPGERLSRRLTASPRPENETFAGLWSFIGFGM